MKSFGGEKKLWRGKAWKGVDFILETGKMKQMTKSEGENRGIWKEGKGKKEEAEE
jgi:hypothetical protein